MPGIRDPGATRQQILNVAAREILVQGYKAASLSDILEKAGVSKGALYHHFANKQALGYAVFEEVYLRDFLAKWDLPSTREDPIEALCEWLMTYADSVTREALELGCPVCNIATEMSGLDEGFRHKAMAMYAALGERWTAALTRARQAGQISESVQPRAVATFLVAAIQGISIQGKYSRNVDSFRLALKSMADYLRSLRHQENSEKFRASSGGL